MARYALVVGITDYTNQLSNLTKPATDAEAVEQVLKAHGDFEDIAVLKGKVSTTKLAEALKTLLQQQAVKNEALIYFTGHGITVSDSLGTQQAYLATSDLTIVTQGKQIIEQTGGISLLSLNNLIRDSDLSSLVVLLDCCHSGEFLERNLIEKTLTAFISQRDYYFIAACRGFQQAFAKKSEQHSIFTTALLAGLSPENTNDRGQVTGDRLFDILATELKGSGQEPIRMGWGRSITLINHNIQTQAETFEVKEECPYQGLKAFEAEQKQFFFGRQQVVRKILGKLTQKPFVSIIGASGSGKSSVVRAGLIPQLENGWQVLEPIMPGVEPLAELKRAFSQLFGRTEIREISTLIDTNGLSSVISRLPGSDRFLLVVDQFEEVFTLCFKDKERRRFIELLTQCPEGRLAIVTTMRADFLEPCLSYELLTQLIQTQAIYMPPLVGADLEEAIASPANLQGYQLERGLLGAIQQEVVGQEKGCLPLLQFALTELWEQRDRQTHLLTVAKYKELGGVIGALNRHAKNLYESFTEQQQDWVKRIFLKLVRTGAEENDTRQRQTKAKLLSIAGKNPSDQQPISDVLEKLIQGRLLVADTELTTEVWVNLAHEALIEGWQQFAEWRQQEWQVRRLVDKVEDALRTWQEEQSDENLMMGGLLSKTILSYTSMQPYLNYEAKEFYQRSYEYREYEIDKAKKTVEENTTNQTTQQLPKFPFASKYWWNPKSLMNLIFSSRGLENTRDFLFQVINTIHDPIYVKNEKHQWIVLNEAYCQFIGYPKSMLLEKSDYDFFPKHEADVFRKQDNLVLWSQEPQENEEEFTDAIGQTHLIATKRSLHKDAAGNFFLVGVIRDITQRKRMEEQLKRAAAELSRSNNELRLQNDALKYNLRKEP